ncbi:MAG TPA: cytochrome d ubiquinol oxidase subunit II, partial [Polyangia bacterium]
ATLVVRPSVSRNFLDHPAGLLLPAAVAASLVVMELAARRDRERLAFWASGVYLVAMLGGAAFALYPVLLPDSTDPARSLTILTAASGSYAMRIALTWWFVALALVTGSFLYLYRTFRGKLSIGGGDDGH